jgi:RND superfamily putative drug exporter
VSPAAKPKHSKKAVAKKTTAKKPKVKKTKAPKKFTFLAVAVVVIWMGISGVAGPLFGKLSEVQENDNAAFLPTTAESSKVSDVATQFTSSDSLPALVVVTGDLSKENLAKANEFAADINSLKIEEGDGKLVSDYLTDGAKSFPIPSEDGEALLISVDISNTKIITPLPNGEPALPAIVKTIRDAAKDIDGLQINVTGAGGILADLFGAFGSIDSTLLSATLIVVALILIVVYRSPLLWIFPLLSAVIALTLAGSVVYLLAKEEIITLNGQSQGILSVLVIGAATDYGLLLIARYREELHLVESRFTAMRKAIRGVFEPIVASGATVSVGLLVLLLSELDANRSLGPVGAIGVTVAVLTMLTLLPALLVIFGRWIFWPRIPHFDSKDEKLSGIWSKVATYVDKKTRRAGLITGILLLALAGYSTQLDATGLSQTETFVGKPDSVVGQEVLGKHFPAGEGNPSYIVGPAAKTQEMLKVITDTPGVGEAFPIPDGPVVPGQPLPQPKIVNNQVLISATLENAADSAEAKETVIELRKNLDSVSQDAFVGGFTAVNEDIAEANARDNRLIIPTVLVIIFFILVILLRSILAPFMLISTVVLSFAATLGACQLVFENIFNFPGSDTSFPLFAFVFLVALGIDYNIFLMTRVREESKKLGTRAGTLKALTVTGGVITSAGVVLAATFAVLGVLPLVFLAQLGFAVAFGVLLDTILVRSVLVPALTLGIGKKIWWPSKLAKGKN